KDRLKRTVKSSTTSIDANGAQINAAPPIACARSIERFTASAVNAAPSWNVTPSRRWNVHAKPSSDVSQLVASAGVNSSAEPGLFTHSSGSYIFARYKASVENERLGSHVVIAAVAATLNTVGSCATTRNTPLNSASAN